eukprot:GFYU01004517.1.p1 GENE.GFYU01004517.1~~GFYU01004517.1.p1  ORF type:complete len:685 (+),score=155.63 GFYU01004517.1:211-2265(+)
MCTLFYYVVCVCVCGGTNMSRYSSSYSDSHSATSSDDEVMRHSDAEASSTGSHEDDASVEQYDSEGHDDAVDVAATVSAFTIYDKITPWNNVAQLLKAATWMWSLSFAAAPVTGGYLFGLYMIEALASAERGGLSHEHTQLVSRFFGIFIGFMVPLMPLVATMGGFSRVPMQAWAGIAVCYLLQSAGRIVFGLRLQEEGESARADADTQTTYISGVVYIALGAIWIPYVLVFVAGTKAGWPYGERHFPSKTRLFAMFSLPYLMAGIVLIVNNNLIMPVFFETDSDTIKGIVVIVVVPVLTKLIEIPSYMVTSLLNRYSITNSQAWLLQPLMIKYGITRFLLLNYNSSSAVAVTSLILLAAEILQRVLPMYKVLDLYDSLLEHQGQKYGRESVFACCLPRPRDTATSAHTGDRRTSTGRRRSMQDIHSDQVLAQSFERVRQSMAGNAREAQQLAKDLEQRKGSAGWKDRRGTQLVFDDWMKATQDEDDEHTATYTTATMDKTDPTELTDTSDSGREEAGVPQARVSHVGGRRSLALHKYHMMDVEFRVDNFLPARLNLYECLFLKETVFIFSEALSLLISPVVILAINLAVDCDLNLARLFTDFGIQVAFELLTDVCVAFALAMVRPTGYHFMARKVIEETQANSKNFFSQVFMVVLFAAGVYYGVGITTVGRYSLRGTDSPTCR